MQAEQLHGSQPHSACMKIVLTTSDGVASSSSHHFSPPFVSPGSSPAFESPGSSSPPPSPPPVPHGLVSCGDTLNGPRSGCGWNWFG